MFQILDQLKFTQMIKSKNQITAHKKKIDNIMFPEVLSNLQHKLKSWHENLCHLYTKSMFILSELGIIPSVFIYLKDDVPICES